MERKIYLDSAATTYVKPEVVNEMMNVYQNDFGNPSSVHSFGQSAMNLVDIAREKIAKAISCKSEEIYFTSGGTEANNFALIGVAHANRQKGNHIITSKIEHDSVLSACKQLETEGFEVTYLSCDKNGIVSLTELMSAITPKTILVSIMTANNEVGTVQNLNAIAQTVHEKGILFHTDAVQAFGAINLNVTQLPIDLMSLSAHKIYGPKGVGALFVKKGVKISPYIMGGKQEHGKRGGTQNVAGIVGFGKAVEIATAEIIENSSKIRKIRDYFVGEVTKNIEGVTLNGHPSQRLPSIVNLSFANVDAESLLLLLDLQGIAVSRGSACSAGSIEPSHTLVAMSKMPEEIKGAIRFSFGQNITREDVNYVVEKLTETIKKLRGMSPRNTRRVDWYVQWINFGKFY